METVDYQTFIEFVKSNSLKMRQGRIFHSSEYIDNEGVVRAYEESSSWGGGEFYQIDRQRSNNEITLEFVSKLLK